jgi:predicted MFS family arabinose efflux permease
MSASTENWAGRVPLMVAHCAGMIDLVALPVWVGALIEKYGFDEPHAGGLATLFLVGAVLSSLFFARMFGRINGRVAATIGFAVSAIAFFAASYTSEWGQLAALHFVAGASAACALSFTHGTIAHSGNPHRVFAMAGLALGLFAILFLGATPNFIAAFGGKALFITFAGVMAVAAIVSAIAFPTITARSAAGEDIVAEVTHLKPAVWFGIAGVSCMALTQSMMFSFLQHIGIDRGFGTEAVTGVLIALGFVSLIPAPLAAFLETRVSQRLVLAIGPVLQALLVLAITMSSNFVEYAAPALVFAPVMIFTHTFAFGVLARLDPTARALAGTPAMLMAGAAIGPILGGALVKGYGYGSLGVAAVVIDLCALVLFSRVHAPARPLATAAVR